MAFDRKAAIKMAAEHNSFSEEQLGTWVEMYHKKGKLSDDDIRDLSDKIPKAKVLNEKIQAEKATAAVILGEKK